MCISFPLKRFFGQAGSVVSLLFLTAVLFAGAGRVAAQELPPAIGVLQSNHEHCTALEGLAAWMGAKLSWQNNGAQGTLALGNRTLVFRSGDAVVTDGGNLRLFPTCPARVDGVMYVPTQATLEVLGGKAVAVPEGLQIALRGRTTVLPMPPAVVPAEKGLPRVAQDLRDPRVPLADLQQGIDQANEVRQYVETFNGSVGQAQPALEAVANSAALKLMRHIPIAGGLIGTAQDTVGAINAAISSGKRLAVMDAEQGLPIRQSLQATHQAGANLTAEAILALRPGWQAALPAVDKQIAQYNRTMMLVRSLDSSLALVNAKVLEFQKAVPNYNLRLSLEPVRGVVGRFQVFLAGRRWQLGVFKEYFTQLLADSETLVPAVETPK